MSAGPPANRPRVGAGGLFLFAPGNQRGPPGMPLTHKFPKRFPIMRFARMLAAVPALAASIACIQEDEPLAASVHVTGGVPVTPTRPDAVTDLVVSGATDTSVTLAFTERTDGTGLPASYDVRFAEAPLSWASAHEVSLGTCKVPLAGTAMGAKRSCTALGLAPSTRYQFQLVAFRGALDANAVFGGLSNVADGATNGPPAQPVASLVLAPSSASVEAGQAVQLVATVRDANGNPLIGRVITWATGNPAAASVSGSGLGTGVGAGSATITAAREGQGGTATITV